MKSARSFVAAVAAISLMMIQFGCSGGDDAEVDDAEVDIDVGDAPGPMEETGKALDEAVEAVGTAGREVGEAAEKVGEAADSR